MKKHFFLLAVLSFFVLSACATKKFYKEFAFPSVRNNVCKSLDGKVVLYAIFVDSKHTGPWTVYDMASTKDSICEAIAWIQQKADEDSIPLNISLQIHESPDGKMPIKGDLRKKTLSATIFGQPWATAERDMFKWSDRLAAMAARSLPKDNSKSTRTKNNLRNKERLIARLRDIHQTDNVALVYFVNNYYKDEASFAFSTSSDKNVEFAVVSYKNPSVIAHEFLHLFGAEDMYVTPFDKKIERKYHEKLSAMFPDEVMTNSLRNLDSMQISDFTRYLIGWDKELSDNFQKPYMRKGWKAARY
ncbi:MAG: hypothetical protein RIT43_1838 [Bacteroidota bacterium]|jgi:hypothetical protein